MKPNFKELSKSITEEEFKDYIGINAYKFAEARSLALAGKQRCFDLWSLIAPGLYTAYYGYWVPTFALTIAFAIGSFIKLNTLTGALFLSIVYINYSLTAKTSYVKYVYKRIYKLKQLESDPHRLKSILQYDGRTSKLAPIAAFFLAIICNSTIIMLVDKINEQQDTPNNEAQQVSAVISEAPVEQQTEAPIAASEEEVKLSDKVKLNFRADYYTRENINFAIKVCNALKKTDHITVDKIDMTGAEKAKEILTSFIEKHEACYPQSIAQMEKQKEIGIKEYNTSHNRRNFNAGYQLALEHEELAIRQVQECNELSNELQTGFVKFSKTEKFQSGGCGEEN